MSKIIIGIHGLRNKPPKWILKHWWKKSIREGLKRTGHPRWFFRFDLVYWAHLLHPKSLKPWIRNEKHPLYMKSHYRPGSGNRDPKSRQTRKIVLDVLEKEMDKIFLNDDLTFNFEAITDRIIRRYFEDLDAYYTKTIRDKEKNERPVKDLIREELARMLRRHRHKKILLIAHSMGSIIAYDVLSQGIPDIKVDTLVTIGSPLGIPIVIRKIHAERHDRSLEIKPQTPECITRAWYNFSDLDDKVVLDYTLADDYRKNSKGIQAVDYVVFNDYEIDGERNPHKSYGYLRTPEISDVLHHFLSER